MNLQLVSDTDKFAAKLKTCGGCMWCSLWHSAKVIIDGVRHDRGICNPPPGGDRELVWMDSKAAEHCPDYRDKNLLGTKGNIYKTELTK